MLTWLVKDMAFSNTLVFVFLSLVALGQGKYNSITIYWILFD